MAGTWVLPFLHREDSGGHEDPFLPHHTEHHLNTKPALCRRLAAPACFENWNLSSFLGSTLWVETPRVWAPCPAQPRSWKEAPPIPGLCPMKLIRSRCASCKTCIVLCQNETPPVRARGWRPSARNACGSSGRHQMCVLTAGKPFLAPHSGHRARATIGLSFMRKTGQSAQSLPGGNARKINPVLVSTGANLQYREAFVLREKWCSAVKSPVSPRCQRR